MTLRVVHYLNQFFAGIGAEDKAETPPGQREGAIGPGRVLQQALGDRAQIVATVYCGDNHVAEKAGAAHAIPPPAYCPANHVAEKPGAVAPIVDLIAEHRPQVVVAGPAFSAGRYGW